VVNGEWNQHSLSVGDSSPKTERRPHRQNGRPPFKFEPDHDVRSTASP
jgi:hypothetical protein